jgi:hypothetical protein
VPVKPGARLRPIPGAPPPTAANRHEGRRKEAGGAGGAADMAGSLAA